MGGSSWNDDFYHDRVSHRAVNNIPTFTHDADVRAGRAATAIHAKLNPNGVKVRESRDSDAHPKSKAIAVMFDVTGSMGSIPRTLQQKLPQLMALLLRKNYIVDPQILVGAIGDYFSDRAPLQIGQFESGIEMDDDITNIFLEGNGGGQNRESYQNAFYFFARKTSIDCFEKRGEKGYLFLIGDEHPYEKSTKREIKDIFGDDVEADIPLAQLVREVKEKYEVFFIVPSQSSTAAGDRGLITHWKEILGAEHVIVLDNAEGVCEVIGSTVGLLEGNADPDKLVDDLRETGAKADVAKNAAAAVDAIAKSAMVKRGATAAGDLPSKDTRSTSTERI